MFQVNRFLSGSRKYFAVTLLPLFVVSCYQGPANGSFLEFLTFQPSYEAFSSPVPVYVDVSGLSAGSITVSNSLGETLSFIPGDVPKQFPSLAAVGSGYTVTTTDPSVSPNLHCQVANPNGPIKYPKTTIYITCGLAFYDLTIQVVGLDPSIAAGSPLVVQNMTDMITRTSDTVTSQAFATKVGDQASYSISFVSIPTGHTCFFPNADGSGNMNGGPMDVKINCISVLEYLPSSKIVGPTDKIVIRLSRHGSIAGCIFNSVSVSGRQNVTSLSPQPTISYPTSPDDDKILILPDVTSQWGSGDSFLQLSNCKIDGLDINAAQDIYYDFTASGNIRYVDASGPGNDATGCINTGTQSCKTIQAGVTACDSMGVPCSVYVAQGTYTVTAPITLSGVTSMIGGFPSGFTSTDSDPSTYPTIIQDNTSLGVCGTAGSFCTPVIVTSNSIGAYLTLLISGFQIQMHQTADYSTGILIQGASFNTGQIRIVQNSIYGNETAASGTGERTGLRIEDSRNIAVVANWIRGASGRSISSGVHLYNSEAFIFWNLIDGLASDASGFSSGIFLENTNSASVNIGVAIAENKINPYQFFVPAISPAKSYGIFLAGDVLPDVVYIFNNNIYTGNGGVTTLGDTAGILSKSATGKYSILNNQIFARLASTNHLGIGFLASPSSSSDIRGNNFFVKTPVQSVGTNYTFCGSVLSQGCLGIPPLVTPILPISGQGIGNFNNSYGDNPRFKTTTLLDIWHLNTTTGAPTSSNSPCTTVYGGIDLGTGPLVPSAFLPFFYTDFDQHSRTTTSIGLTPSGADSISVGVFEADANCL